ncbi:class I tRNA ligase family protein, partial [Candidatus Woesearchaeota archaeon]|nr:class I tRNA ligase family protein [Candidatus Woesearchaeota archaeon]
DIFDVWYDSGVAPFASLHYPFENKKLFEDHYPVSRINESQDQIRGWFYSLMFCGVATFNKAPYQEVSMPGWVVDSKGEKMSKSIGNVVYAKDAIEEVGSDSLRFYYMWDIAPCELQLFNKDTIKKEVWKILNILINLNTYLINLTDKITKTTLKNPEDKWLISKLNTLIKNYNENIDKFEYHTATRDLADFVLNTLSRGYIHIIRDRSEDKAVSYVLYEALTKVLVLLAPITPYLSEHLYQQLKKKYNLKAESIHLLDWFNYDKSLIYEKLESDMTSVKELIASILSEREKVKIGIRWPLQRVTIITRKSSHLVERYSNLIKSLTNIKELEVEDKEPVTKQEYDVILDTVLSPGLELEGFAREITRKIQELRKTAKLTKKDKIELGIFSNYDLSSMEKEIKDKVQAKSITFKKTSKKYEFKAAETVKGREFEILFNKI